MVWFSGSANLTVSFRFIPAGPCCRRNEVWVIIRYNSTCMCKISQRSLRLAGVFRDRVSNGLGQIMLLSINLGHLVNTADPGCHGNKIWHKLGYSWVCIRDISDNFALVVVFRGRSIEWCHSNSTSTDPGCHGNKIWHKMGYNWVCIRNISEILVSCKGFSGSGYWMMSLEFFHDRPWLP